jgi:hypothetical protein
MKFQVIGQHVFGFKFQIANVARKVENLTVMLIHVSFELVLIAEGLSTQGTDVWEGQFIFCVFQDVVIIFVLDGKRHLANFTVPLIWENLFSSWQSTGFGTGFSYLNTVQHIFYVNVRDRSKTDADLGVN